MKMHIQTTIQILLALSTFAYLPAHAWASRTIGTIGSGQWGVELTPTGASQTNSCGGGNIVTFVMPTTDPNWEYTLQALLTAKQLGLKVEPVTTGSCVSLTYWIPGYGQWTQTMKALTSVVIGTP